MATGRRPYVYALDWLRAATIIGVIAVHGVRLSLQGAAPDAEGLVQMILQFGREGFMVMTGFVLTYQYAFGRPAWLPFWRRRFQNIVWPYLIWVLVFLILEVGINPAGGLFRQYVSAVETGNGHLYYLLITMQLYVITPLMVWGVRKAAAYRWPLAIAAVLLEVGLWTLPTYVHPSLGDILGLWTYIGFYVLGSVAGYHWPALESWLRGHRGTVALAALAALAVMIPVYESQVAARGVIAATNVFQPVSVVYTLGVVALLLALGTWYADWRLRGGKAAVMVFLLSEYSFAMYLIHPMFLQAWLWWSHQHLALDPWVNAAIAVTLGWTASLGASMLLRRLPAAPYLIGLSRAAHVQERRPVPAEAALRSSS